MPFDPATLAVAANVGQVVSAAHPIIGTAVKAASTSPANTKVVISDTAKMRIESAMTALSQFSKFAEVSPDIEKQYKLYEEEFLTLNQLYKTSAQRAKMMKERTWRQRISWTAIRASYSERNQLNIQEISEAMSDLTLRMTSASAGAESEYNKLAKKVHVGLTHELDIQMFELYAEKDAGMSTGEFVANVVRPAAVLVLPTPSAVEIYVNLITSKLNALSPIPDLPEDQSSTSPTTLQSPISTQSNSGSGDDASIGSSSNSNPFSDSSEVIAENIAMVDLSGTRDAAIRERTPRRRMSTADMV
ncbi:hypothetical protein K435DRAFT_970485 [Dendrothele bispora CBS 962.96]|uniref:Uncharacterized protein n=1 Tax=Dendrothele bispora (strain CBS 962.96) TaxID=1314807 RepID=A0A4S8KKA7_DENBC|nr:hypothetical protein K435DRAFT_974640 [Dendrothele bispora CBS 962.96]THU85932.1 hypothetical protein K435DRAFT_970485 [Dendrothele bispora CBS 962.96]